MGRGSGEQHVPTRGGFRDVGEWNMVLDGAGWDETGRFGTGWGATGHGGRNYGTGWDGWESVGGYGVLGKGRRGPDGKHR